MNALNPTSVMLLLATLRVFSLTLDCFTYCPSNYKPLSDSLLHCKISSYMNGYLCNSGRIKSMSLSVKPLLGKDIVFKEVECSAYLMNVPTSGQISFGGWLNFKNLNLFSFDNLKPREMRLF